MGRGNGGVYERMMSDGVSVEMENDGACGGNGNDDVFVENGVCGGMGNGDVCVENGIALEAAL